MMMLKMSLQKLCCGTAVIETGRARLQGELQETNLNKVLLFYIIPVHKCPNVGCRYTVSGSGDVLYKSKKKLKRIQFIETLGYVCSVL